MCINCHVFSVEERPDSTGSGDHTHMRYAFMREQRRYADKPEFTRAINTDFLGDGRAQKAVSVSKWSGFILVTVFLCVANVDYMGVYVIYTCMYTPCVRKQFSFHFLAI